MEGDDDIRRDKSADDKTRADSASFSTNLPPTNTHTASSNLIFQNPLNSLSNLEFKDVFSSFRYALVLLLKMVVKKEVRFDYLSFGAASNSRAYRIVKTLRKCMGN